MGSKNRADATLPAETVRLLFTDVGGSSRLGETHAEIMQMALARQEALLRDILTESNGHAFNAVGDAVDEAFANRPEAVAAAAALRAITGLR